MKITKSLKKISAVLLVISFCIISSACSGLKNIEVTYVTEKDEIVSCSNGIFEGIKNGSDGVLSFKGIPYAKAPVGELRWKAPVEAPDSNESFEAKKFGKSSIQYYRNSEPIETDVGEDCLTLNIFTKNMRKTDKTVMVFFHGGAYAWGGSSEPVYDATNMADNNNNFIFITCNFRVGIMGFADFENVPGGENYPDSKNLGLLDAIAALKWIKKNISAFGGNPDNITIFGEGAGGGIVTSLLATEYAGELFKRAIIESGSANLIATDTQSDTYLSNVEALMAVTGAKTMDDLMSLTEQELIEANSTPIDDKGTTINDLFAMPVSGNGVLPEDLYGAIKNGNAKNVDIIIGTNLNEMNYMINESDDIDITKTDKAGIVENIALFGEYFINPGFDLLSEISTKEQNAAIEEYLSDFGEEELISAKSDILSDVYYRLPSVAVAENHSQSNGTGKTYMYLFEKENDDSELYGACHATELEYVFRNLGANPDELDTKLSDNIYELWTSFAKTGTPSAEYIKWDEYDIQNKSTLIIGNDGVFKMENDPYSERREMLSYTVEYNLIPMKSK